MDGIFPHKSKKKTFWSFYRPYTSKLLLLKKNIPVHLKSLEGNQLLTLKKMSTQINYLFYYCRKRKTIGKSSLEWSILPTFATSAIFQFHLIFSFLFFSLSRSPSILPLLVSCFIVIFLQVWILGLRHVTKHIKKCVHNLLTTLQSIFNPPHLFPSFNFQLFFLFCFSYSIYHSALLYFTVTVIIFILVLFFFFKSLFIRYLF